MFDLIGISFGLILAVRISSIFASTADIVRVCVVLGAWPLELLDLEGLSGEGE